MKLSRPVISISLFTAWLGLSACGSVVEMVSPSDIDPPAQLQNIAARINLQNLWRKDVGSGTDGQLLHLKPKPLDNRLYVAEASGQVEAFDAQTGRTIWQADVQAPISGGPGAGDGLVLVGTSDAEVIALDQNNGQLRWRARVSSEVLSTPAVASERVIIRTIDGKIIGLDARNGKEVWRYEREIPVLTLRGTGSPVISGTNVLCGMAGGKLLMLDIRSGQVIWDATISIPAGRSELERLADIDGDPVVLDGAVYVATYQGDIAAVSEYSGTLLWRRKFSSYSGMAADRRNLYASDAEGSLWAMNAETGASLWRIPVFKNRRLSDVAVVNDVVAVGDYEGYIHFVSADDGKQIGRTRVGKAPITKGLASLRGLLFVQGDAGDLEAMRVSQQN